MAWFNPKIKRVIQYHQMNPKTVTFMSFRLLIGHLTTGLV